MRRQLQPRLRRRRVWSCSLPPPRPRRRSRKIRSQLPLPRRPPPTRRRRLIDNFFTSTAGLRTAAQEYNANEQTAIATYGPVADWDVSAITNMYQLFYGLSKFNADISSWNTSGVTDMRQMFRVRSARVCGLHP